MPESATVASVLSRYSGLVPLSVDPLGNAGGFSGAALWRIEAGGAHLCLRRWPREHPSDTQLKFIHDVLDRVAAGGLVTLPKPLRSRDGQSFVTVEGHFWELTPWLPGTADFHQNSSRQRLDAALVALAHFHRGSASFEPRSGIPPGIQSRREQLKCLGRGGTIELSQAITKLSWQDFNRRAGVILSRFHEHAANTKALLERASCLRVPLQPCIRDIWHDHVLFLGDEVSGLIDFGAMQTDHVACDVSRLLGSLAKGDRARWGQGLAAYQSIRPLTDDERLLVEAYDRSTALISGTNWIRWIAVEGRKFDDHQRVLNRLDDIIDRLQQM